LLANHDSTDNFWHGTGTRTNNLRADTARDSDAERQRFQVGQAQLTHLPQQLGAPIENLPVRYKAAKKLNREPFCHIHHFLF
jgi:hypothetical protein